MPSPGTAGGKPEIKIDGTALSEDLTARLSLVVVDDHLHLPDQVMIVIRDPAKTGIDESRAKIGSVVELVGVAANASGSGVVSGKLFHGEVTSLEADFEATKDNRLVIRAHDVSHRMHRGRRTEAYKNMTDGDIARRVAGRNGVSVGKVESGVLHEHVSQVNLTDWEFVKARAREIGFETGVEDQKFYFRKQSAAGAPAATCTFGEDLQSFHPRVSSVAQVKKVKARGWDYERKEAAIGEARASSGLLIAKLNGASFTPEKLGAVFPTPDFVVTERVLRNQGEAQMAADGMAAQIVSAIAEADGLTRGNPAIQAGKKIKIESTQAEFTGEWLVTASRHIWDDQQEGYRTFFTVSGHQERSMLGLASLGATSGVPSAGGPPILGVVPALVTNVKDPKNLYRVKVKFPWLDDAYETDWVRVAHFGGGQGGYGGLSLPEVNDEVLVTFEQGDSRRPYVIGALYNGKDRGHKPDTVIGSDGRVKMRGYRSRKGHQFTIYDGPDKSGIAINTGNRKLKIVLNETTNKITIECDGDIEITSKMGNIKMKAQQNIELETVVGAMKMSAGSTASLEAKATTTVKGSIVNIN